MKRDINKKETWSDLNIKTKIAYSTAVGSLLIGWVLVIINFVYPPLGEVSDASLWILGQTFLYLGAVVGVTTYTRGQITEIRRELNLKEDEDEV